jgi:LmbE family N-acetylglucosaminyl deacetylase
VNDLQWAGAPPRFRPRVVIAAPHPDDEVLGCAGVMSWLDRQGYAVEIVAVTDGDASHAESRRVSRAALVHRRQRERASALASLGLAHVPVHRLGFPDAGIASTEPELTEALASRLDSLTTLLVPWRHDGHPDHEAVARAGIAAATACGADYLEVPIWARVRGRRCNPSYVLVLGAGQPGKRRAAETYRSQVIALGPDPCDGPVVHPGELDALTSPTEWLVQAR